MNRIRHLGSAGLLTLAVALLAVPAVAKDKKVSPNQAKAQRDTTADENKLPEVVITAEKAKRNPATTDGTGSYASGAVTVAGKTPTKRIDIPQSVSVLTRQQIEDQHLTTVDQALAKIPGVTMISNDASQSQYYIRGFSPESMVDGSPTLSGLNGYQQFDTAIYDRVEVLKGPAGLLMGQGSPSGVVNFVKKTPKDIFGASLLTSIGSWANKRAELDVTGPLGEEKRVRWRGVLAGTDRNFYFKSSHDTKWTGFGTVEVDLTQQTTLTLSAVHQDDKAPVFSGLPAYVATGAFIDASRSTNPYPTWAKYLWNTQEYTAALEHRFDNAWTAKVSYTKRYQEFEFKDAYPSTGIDAAGNATYARRWNVWNYERDSADAFVRGPIELFGRTHELLLGANYAFWGSQGKRVTYSTVPGNIFNPDSTVTEPFGDFTSGTRSEQSQWGVYGQSKIQIFEPLSVILGGRLSWYDSRSRATEPSVQTPWTHSGETDGRLSPYAAAVYQLTKGINAYASYSDIFVPQSQVKWGGGTLDPRVGSQYEVGLKGEFLDGKLQASGALFYIEDTGRSYADPAHLNYYLNAGKAESKGIEFEVSGEILRGWQATAGYTYNYTELVKASSYQGTPISEWLPRHSFKLWNQYTVQDGTFKGLSAGLGVVAYSSSSDTGTVPVRFQDPYAVVDLQLGYEFNKHLKANFAVNNVFDTVYRTRIGGLNTYNTYGDPRNFLLTVKATF